jgi:hypothetical protein
MCRNRSIPATRNLPMTTPAATASQKLNACIRLIESPTSRHFSFPPGGRIMASSFHKRRNRSGLVGSWLRRLFLSGGAPDKTDAGRRRRSGRGERPLTFEACEDRRLLAIGVDWTAPTLTLTGTPGADQVTVVGSSSYVDVYANGSFQARLTTANSGNVSTISFTGGALNDSLSVQNIQGQVGGALAVSLTGAERLSVSKCRDLTVTSDGALNFGTTTITGALDVSAGGAVTQSGAIVVAGATTLDAGTTNDITLLNASNNFSSVTITSGNDVSLRDVNSLVLGNGSDVTGNLTVLANMSSSKGTLSESGPISVGVDATFTVGSGSTITLTSDTGLIGNTFGGTLSLTAKTASITTRDDTAFGNVSVSGNLTVVANAGDISQSSGAMVVRGTASFRNTGRNITLDSLTNNFATVTIPGAADVQIVDVNAVNLGAINSTNLDVQTDGAITQTGALTVGTLVKLDAGETNDITLTKSSNGSPNFEIVSGRNVALRNSGNVNFAGAVSTVSGSLTVTAGGTITQTGGVNVLVDGPTTLKGTSITLAEATNNFSTVSIPSAATAILADADAIDIGVSKITGATFTISSAGDVTQSGAILAKSATTSVTATAGTITLDSSANDFGTVTVDASTAVSGQDVTLRDTNAMTLGAFHVHGALDVQANLNASSKVALQQAAGTILNVSDATTLKVGAASTITLNKDNTMAGAVSVTSAANATLTNTPTIQLGDVNVSGNLAVVVTSPTAGADVITQVPGDALVVGKVATFTAGSGSDIAVTGDGNDFRTVAVTAARNVDITDKNAVVLDAFATQATPIAGDMTITADGTVSQSAAMYVTGAATFDVGPLNDVILTNTSNRFSSSGVSNGVGITSARNVQLVDSSGGIALNASTIGGNLAVTATDSGTPANATITQNGAVSVGGTATLSAASVTLTSANDFYTVASTASDAVQLTDMDDVILGTSTIGGALTVTAPAGISQSGALNVTGTTTLSTGNDSGSINLDLGSNDFSTVTVSRANNVSLRDRTALTLDALGAAVTPIAGTLTVAAGGAISQSAAAYVAGDATFATSTTADVTLNNSSNTFSGAVGVTAGNDVTLVNDAALKLGTTRDIASLAVTARGAVTQGDSVAVTGTTTVTAEDAATTTQYDVTLDNAANDFATVVLDAANNATLKDANAIDLGESTVEAALSVTAGADPAALTGEITDSGKVIVKGDATFIARNAVASFSITLDQSDSEYQGQLSLTGDNVQLTNAYDTVLANCDAIGDLTVKADNSADDASFTNLFSGGGHGVIKVGGATHFTADDTIDLNTVDCVFGNWPEEPSDLVLTAPTVHINP